MSRSADTVSLRRELESVRPSQVGEGKRLGLWIIHVGLIAIAGSLLTQCSAPRREAALADVQANAVATILEGKVQPKSLPASRGNKDGVQWVNSDDVGYSLDFIFEGWPFIEPPQSVLIEAKGKSKVFTVWQSVPKGAYSYRVHRAGLFTPEMEQGEGPPDPPHVSVGD